VRNRHIAASVSGVSRNPGVETLLLGADDSYLVHVNLDVLFMSASAAHRDDLNRVLAGVQQQTLYRVVEFPGMAHNLPLT